MNNEPKFLEAMFTQSNSEKNLWDLIESLYQKNYVDAVPSSSLRIPKIIHQIWLGSKLPEKLVSLQNTWKKYHPDWEYHLWTDEEVKKLNLRNRDLYEKVKNFGAKSDILRYEILYQFGGLYVDTDFECLKSFEDLHHLCDFYAGVFEAGEICVSNGLIGSCPQSDVIRECMEKITKPQKRIGENFGLNILETVGPMHFTKCILNILPKTNDKCVIFPSLYFYPSPNSNTGKPTEIQKEFIKPESYAIHYWYVSWGTQVYWKKILRKILNYFVDYGNKS